MNLNQQFKKIISSSFNTLLLEDLKPVVRAIWHENYVPNINLLNLESQELNRAGYLVDRFRRFNCVEDSTKQELNYLVKTLKEATLTHEKVNSDNPKVEKLAIEWNLNEDVSGFMCDLLEFQTRHYKHSA